MLDTTVEEKKAHPHPDRKLDVVMVVNGAPYEMSFPEVEKLKAVVAQTLAKTGNTGQPPENWELRDEAGNLLDLEKRLRDYDFSDGVKLFLNPKAGVGG